MIVLKKNIFKKIVLSCLLISGLLSTIQANFNKSDFKNNFYGYYSELNKIERDLISLELDPKVLVQVGEDFELFFSIYEEKLDEVFGRVKVSGKKKQLTRLQGHTLEVRVEYIRATYIYGPLHSIKDEKDLTIKRKLISTRDKILEWDVESPANLVDGNLTESDKKVISYLHALYADNLYRSILLGERDRPRSFGKELEKQALDALRYDPENDYAKLLLGIFYQFVGSGELSKSLLEEVINSQKSIKDKDETIVFRAWLWMSQYNILAFKSREADLALLEAEKVYPRSGLLNYAKELKSVNRPMIRGDGGLLKDPEKRNYFYYRDIVGVAGAIFSRPTFNFVDKNGDGAWRLYVEGGFSPSPLGLALGLGVIRSISHLDTELGFVYKLPFKEVKGGHFYALKFGLTSYVDDFTMEYNLYYGSLWNNIFTEQTATEIAENKARYSRYGNHAIENTLSLNYEIYRSAYNLINTKLELSYTHSFTAGGGVINTDFSLPMELFDVGWSVFKFRPLFNYARSISEKGGFPAMVGRTSFFDYSPEPIDFDDDDNNFLSKDSVNGSWQVNVELAYRFYPLYTIPSNSLVKGLYFSPSVFIGWAKPEINSAEHKLTYSVLGNIGLSLMRSVNLALGVGYNPNEGLVINLLAY